MKTRNFASWLDNMNPLGRLLFQHRLATKHLCGFRVTLASTESLGPRCPYEESIRTPMILSGGVPRYAPWKNGRLPVLSNHVDIAPTTLGLGGIRMRR
jgi:hypothetical protein